MTLSEDIKHYQKDPDYVAEYLCTTLGMDFYQCMTERGLTTKELSKLTGYSVYTLDNIFNGSLRISLYKIAKIAIALNVKPRFSLEAK